MMTRVCRWFAALPLLWLCACASSYIPPGGKADLRAITPPSIQQGFDAKASASFPAGIALVRVQAPSYTNHRLARSSGTYGSGNYSVVTTREVETDAQLDKLAALPQVAGITGLNRMLLPDRLDSFHDLRVPASRVQADMLLVYTFETSFFENDLAKPLTIITLGFSPTRKVYVTTTVSALLIDTRTGYIYSTYEATSKSDTLATSWSTDESADAARRQNEQGAFGQLVDEVAKSWPRLLARYQRKS